MLSTKQYVPILKWKPGEEAALQHLKSEDRAQITPLLQIVMPQPERPKKGEKPKSSEEQYREVLAIYRNKLPQFAEEIANAWGNEKAFLDLSLVYTPALRVEGLQKILPDARSRGMSLLPVINLCSDPETKEAAKNIIKKYGGGFCLRLVRSDFEDQVALEQSIKQLLVFLVVSEDDVDLLIDLKYTHVADKEYDAITVLVQSLGNLQKWRSFILASGSFPEDLTGFKVGEIKPTPRTDWTNWKQIRDSSGLARVPIYSDYTIQHPIYKEANRFYTPSSSIKYTYANNWLIMRGQKGKPVQYLGYAQLLSQNRRFANIYCGEEFSFGDKFISDKGKTSLNTIGKKKPKTGNSTNWIVAGINHHLVFTARELASLS